MDNNSNLEDIVTEVKNDFLNKTLEDSVKNLDSSSPSNVLSGFSYLKYDLENILKSYLDIDKSISYINKDELKQPLYGVISCEDIKKDKRGFYKSRRHELQKRYNNISSQVCDFRGDSSSYLRDVVKNSLSDWEKLMFYSGIWRANFDDINIKNSDFKENLKNIIKRGYNNIHQKHMIKYNKNDYKRKLKVPKSQNYRVDSKNDIDLKMSSEYENKLEYYSKLMLERSKKKYLFLGDCENGDFLDRFLFSYYDSGRFNELNDRISQEGKLNNSSDKSIDYDKNDSDDDNTQLSLF